MVNQTFVHELVSQVVYNESYNALVGLDPLRNMLWKDTDGAAAALLEQEIAHASDRVRGGIAFLLGARYLETGRMDAIRALYKREDPVVKEYLLDSLKGKPTASIELGPGIVEIAIEGMSHISPGTRAAACSTIMNQCAWGVDVSNALNPLLMLIEDASPKVRQSAMYALGNISKVKRYDLDSHIALTANLVLDKDTNVSTAACWALWKLSNRRDIGCAVPNLIQAFVSASEFDWLLKNASGALLSFARKSHPNCVQIQLLAADANLDASNKVIARFLAQLETCCAQPG